VAVWRGGDGLPKTPQAGVFPSGRRVKLLSATRRVAWEGEFGVWGPPALLSSGSGRHAVSPLAAGPLVFAAGEGRCGLRPLPRTSRGRISPLAAGRGRAGGSGPPASAWKSCPLLVPGCLWAGKNGCVAPLCGLTRLPDPAWALAAVDRGFPGNWPEAGRQ